MIELHQFPPVFGRNISPFTLKLEAWLRLAGLPYQVVTVLNPGRSPKGKLPFIVDDDGTAVADSSLIIDYLARTRGVDLDRELSREQRAQAVALQRLFEDHFYFVGVWSRWIDPDGWHAFAPAMFGSIPPPARQAVAALVRRRMRNMLRAQGLGRHGQAELYGMGRADLDAISAMLDAQPFFFGARPVTIDAIAYGFLDNLINAPIETGLKRIAREFANLVAYCERMSARLGFG